MKLSPKTKKTLSFLAFVLFVGLIAGQVFLQKRLIELYSQAQQSQQEKQRIENEAQLRSQVISGYDVLTRGDQGKELRRPESPVEFYTTVEGVLEQYGIRRTSITPQQVGDGGDLGLNIAFAGPYYSFMKAIAALRQSPYLMKITTMNITYYTPDKGDASLSAEGSVSGTMTIVSVLQN